MVGKPHFSQIGQTSNDDGKHIHIHIQFFFSLKMFSKEM